MAQFFFTSGLGTPQSKLARVRLGEPSAAYDFDALAVSIAETALVSVTVGVADALALGIVEDGALKQEAVFFTARLGWHRAKLSYIRLGEPDSAYVLNSLQIRLNEGSVKQTGAGAGAYVCGAVPPGVSAFVY